MKLDIKEIVEKNLQQIRTNFDLIRRGV